MTNDPTHAAGTIELLHTLLKETEIRARQLQDDRRDQTTDLRKLMETTMTDDALRQQISELEATIADLEAKCERKDDELVSAHRIADNWEHAYETLSDAVHTLFEKAHGKAWRKMSPEDMCTWLLPYAESPWTGDDAVQIRKQANRLGETLSELVPSIRVFSEFSSPGTLSAALHSFNRMAEYLGIDAYLPPEG